MIKKIAPIEKLIYLLIFILVTGCSNQGSDKNIKSYITETSVRKVQEELIKKYGEQNRDRILKGSGQLSKNWRKTDGTKEEFEKFCIGNFINDTELKSNFQVIQKNLTLQNGYLSKLRFRFNESENFTDAKEEKVDSYFRKSIPGVDAYKEKLAQFIQLNFPYYSLGEKRQNGHKWDREKWAMVRLGDMYSERHNPDFKADASEEVKDFQNYLKKYFFRMDHICMPDGSYPFTKALTLHSHFGLRDNLKEEYTRPGGLARQELTGRIIGHIIEGTVPVEFIQDTTTRWNPWAGKLFKTDSGKLVQADYKTEGVKRYAGYYLSLRIKAHVTGYILTDQR